MLPLSFQEYVSASKEDKNIDRLFQKYISLGSFPYVLNFDDIDDMDNYPKYILTNDIEPETTFDGIRKINVLDCLLEK